MELKWQLAGLSAVQSGHVGRLIPEDEVLVVGPLELDEKEEHLLLGGDGPNQISWYAPDRALLNEFALLWKKSPKQILAFAQKRGVLKLGSTGRPCEFHEPEIPEPIELWRYFSRRVHGVLNALASLKLGHPAEPEDWATMSETANHVGDFFESEFRRFHFFDSDHLAEKQFSTSPRSVQQEGTILAAECNFWLRLCRVGFAVSRDDGGLKMGIDFGGHLLGAIALQLALAASDIQAILTCSACHRPYARERKMPKKGHSNFCTECGREAAVKQAENRRREKVRQAHQLYLEGMPVSEIALKLETTISSVERWIGKGPVGGKTREQ